MGLKKDLLPVVGILGGGQLGRMFIQSALNFVQEIHVLDPDENAPCSTLASNFVIGSFSDYAAVLEFGSKVDILTVEIEHVNTQALKELQSAGVQVFPQPEILEMIQDKGLQKQFFEEHEFTTSPFTLIQSKVELEQLDESWFPCFQKLRTLGYDGKGVQHLKSKADIHLGFDEPSVIEKAVQVKSELAVIVASNGKGDVKTFPAVDMVFHPTANLVEFLSAPSILPEEIQNQATQLAIDLAKKTGIRGILAVEFLLDQNNQLLLNEMAPRTHNSGHHTLEGNRVSQFEQQLRAILGWPLGATETTIPAVMVNVLGEPGFHGEAIYSGLEEILAIDGVSVHLYGKVITKPFRKMGHVTVTDPDLQRALRTARFVKQTLKVIS
jgi:5-(carboxyamino)imidazole ribonucleotide synthase